MEEFLAQPACHTKLNKIWRGNIALKVNTLWVSEKRLELAFPTIIFYQIVIAVSCLFYLVGLLSVRHVLELCEIGIV